jgi:hypothetical protein
LALDQGGILRERGCWRDECVEEAMLKGIDEKFHQYWVCVGALNELKLILK